MTQTVSCWELFTVFAKVGAFTIGGGLAMIPLIEKEISDRGWASADELENIIVLAQSAPGLLAVNAAVFTGYKLAGLKGSIMASIGAVLPSFVIILLIAMFFTGFKDNPVVQRIFQGVRPVAIALIFVPAVNMAKSGCKSWWAYLIAAATLVCIAFLKVSPIWIILVTITVASGVFSLIQRAKK